MSGLPTTFASSPGFLIPLIILQRNWDYEPLSFTSYTSDDNLLKITTKVDRLGRSDYAFSMTLNWNYDVDEDTMVEAEVYHCSSGDEEDYKIMPWSLPQQPFFDYLNGFYKDAFIKNVGHCSNMVQFEGDFVPPWPRNVYILDKCVANGEGLPDIAPEGYFKIVYKMSGQVDWGFTLIVKVEHKVI
ncbi:uncharacterized protein LOC108029981 isoform X1 [Drosophila biarmipes]|uniref:uncharacterized protein LOC108029981 isoform X1 n=1 Tax=Drosophila biarmipes TaxID=125945 RepID=UPI0007E65391|nr:uncharacterized protein LOC108029981 isoform X1 [Drosophila biarmipes]